MVSGCLRGYSIFEGQTGWVRSALEKGPPDREMLLFYGLQGPGESPHLKLCEFNDFFRDLLPLPLQHILCFYTTQLSEFEGKKVRGVIEKRARSFL